MKTKLDVAREALGEINDGYFHSPEAYRQYASKALTKIKAMPDENCGNCRLFKPAYGVHLCNGNGILEQIEETDFCSRFEPKEKAE